MQIDRSSSKPPVAGAQPAKPAAPVAAAPGAKMAGDSYQANDVKVITFNTAVGNSKIKTDQGDFVKLPFYQSVIKGDANAPILCLQEVGNEQRKAIEKLAKNGHFTVLSQRVGLNFKGNNLMLVPKRYQVESTDNSYFGMPQVKAAAKTILGWFKGEGKPSFNKLWQLVSLRGYQEMQLKDSATGKAFTVFNTHTSYDVALKGVHAKQLFDAAREAEKRGPVIVAGDLNTYSGTDPGSKASDADARQHFDDYTDMGAPGTAGDRHNIDWVLAKGFESVSSKLYTGDSISLPSAADASLISDHYAEEDVLRFKDETQPQAN
ncbi:MAG: endonuclease/exonuclease/phosphatase family protein [Candidatus Sericytochromatia bacterium]